MEISLSLVLLSLLLSLLPRYTYSHTPFSLMELREGLKI